VSPSEPFQVIFQFNSKFNQEVYIIWYEFHISVPSSKQFHVGKLHNVFQRLSIQGRNGNGKWRHHLWLKYFWTMDYMCTRWISRHTQTHPVLELDRTRKFHHETPIPFAALVTRMQIDSNSHHYRMFHKSTNSILHVMPWLQLRMTTSRKPQQCQVLRVVQRSRMWSRSVLEWWGARN